MGDGTLGLVRSHTRTMPSSPAVTRVLISANPTPRTSASWALIGGPKGTGWAGVAKLPQVNCPVNEADRENSSVRTKSYGVRAGGFMNGLTERRRMIEVSEIPEATFLVFAAAGQCFSDPG